MSIYAFDTFDTSVSCRMKRPYKLKTNHNFNIEDNALFRKITKKIPLSQPIILQFLECKTNFTLHADKFRFFDVGCGCGEFGFLLWEHFAKNFHASGVFLDPDDSALRITREAYRTSTSRYPESDALISPGKFENFRSSFVSLMSFPFDLVLMSHVIYYFSDWTREIKRGLEMLRDGGTLCVVLKAKSSLSVFEFRERLMLLLDLEPPETFEFSEDLEHILRDANIPYDLGFFHYEVTLPVSENHPHDPNSDLMRILRFIFHIPLHEYLEDPYVTSLLEEFIWSHTKNDQLSFRLIDTFFFLNK